MFLLAAGSMLVVMFTGAQCREANKKLFAERDFKFWNLLVLEEAAFKARSMIGVRIVSAGCK